MKYLAGLPAPTGFHSTKGAFKKMRTIRHLLVIFLILTLTTGLTFSQASRTTPNETPKTARVVGALLGGLGGFLIAAALVDDDRNTSGEFLTALIAGPAAGAIGGYFLGRAIDRRSARFAYQLDPMLRQGIKERMVEDESRRLNLKAKASGILPTEEPASLPQRH